jgi:hypothetical protein
VCLCVGACGNVQDSSSVWTLDSDMLYIKPLLDLLLLLVIAQLCRTVIQLVMRERESSTNIKTIENTLDETLL